MKTVLVYTRLLIISLLTTVSCTNKTDTNACTYPHRVSIDPACYTGNGVQLTASEYGDSPSGFEWRIYALRDTARVLGFTPKDLKIDLSATNTFTVPDSIASNYQRLIVTVAANCQGQSKHSRFYGFNKTKSAAGSCTVWTSQNN